ncbi:MAG: iron ABC transporter permease [Candidatus Krumholzibacteriota bacterium]|nr:iron ABC transporter permease [Candidatus Krumholzibacteriota bacterium]
MVLVAMYSLTTGPYPMTTIDAFNAFIGNGSYAHRVVIWNIRMMRIATAIFAGAALAVSGMVMQNVLRNPLASPSTLGVSHAASFGAAFGIVVLGAGSTQAHSVSFDLPFFLALCAFASTLMSTGVILLLARIRDASTETMILAGVAMASLFTAGTTSLRYFASDEVQLASIIFWTFGDLGRTDWTLVTIISVGTVATLIYFFLNRWRYNAMNSSEEVAHTLGVNTSRTRILGLLISSLLTALVVSFVGIIGFVGLVVPHIVRRIVGTDARFLIPGCCIAGALLLLVSDTVARTLLSPVIMPVGILTSFLGAPLFIYLIIRGRKHW